jgi:AraC-like DNA-binding protein
MTIPATDTSFQIRARAILLRDPSLPVEDLAVELAMPVDSVRRRLRAEGQTLSTLRENVRRDKAVHWLVTSNRSVESIAFELGYSEARSFTRAFSQWTGASPSVYRRAHAAHENGGFG